MKMSASANHFRQEFWSYLDRLVADSPVAIDRPRGSTHPRYPQLVYPLDYGYLEGTETVDGGGIDVFIGSLSDRRLEALALTVDLDKHDAEIKLLLGCSQAEQQTVFEFLNGAAMRASLVQREDGVSLLRERRSVRRFRPDPVPRDTLNDILETAAWAPSAHNRQPWRFAALTSMAAKSTLAQALGEAFERDLAADGLPADEVATRVNRSRQRITQAPVCVLLCLDPTVGDVYPDETRQEAEYLMGVQSVALAGGQLLLAAHAQGLGGVWMCAPLFAPGVARGALGLPAAWQPQALLLLGYAEVIPPPRSRRPLEEIARFY